ncbi:unnamed protein product [Clonostachys rosea]|uniref:Heterokaryon incompatibility domain-containing protein n=1 Tax=Bionectria ochroleuca TaxID=29856 RepID=A0ABY6UPG5_BIOOC|nr:unnamed protein product [Clonostachys rosea]
MPDIQNRPLYAFTALGLGDSFRLLELLPGLPSEPLRGRLHVREQPSEADYETLSYVWGSAECPHAIEIDGNPLLITTNLHSALRRLRLQTRPRTLWVDSICINQADNEEKAKQVHRMGDFYRHAKGTIAYLGEAADGSEEAINLVHRVLAAKDQLSQMLFFTAETLARYGLPHSGHQSWNNLAAVLDRPWWTRYWIIQEAVLSKRVIIVCGKWECDWKPFTEACRFIDEMALVKLSVAGSDNAPDALRDFSNLCAMRDAMEDKGPSWPLVHLLERSRTANATDQHDYIYGLLALCAERAGIREGVDTSSVDWMPNYNETAAETFTRFARYIVSWGDGIHLLYSITHRNSLEGLPSWVPNWADRDIPWRPLAPRTDGARNYPFQAASPKKPHLKLSTISDHLVVRGLFLGTLVEVGTPAHLKKQPNWWDPEGDFSRDMATVSSFARDLLSFLNKHRGTTLSEGEVMDLTWRTMCCNVDALTLQDADPRLGDELQFILDLAPHWELSVADRHALHSPTGIERLSRLRDANNFLMRSAPFCLRRRPALTDGGRPCLVPDWAEKGDEVFLPFGSAVPFVVKPDLDGYSVRGECYVHGVMYGEVFKDQESGPPVQDVTLV